MTFFAKSTSDKITQQEYEKSKECKWFTREELENSQDIKPHVKYYALKALDYVNSK